jgi:RNAse (barnase) inhibitor barstar
MTKKPFTLDATNFSTLNEFYDEVGKVFCPNFNWGRNLDAFNDILRGGFEVYEYEEPIELVWKNSEKSRNDLGYNETVKQLKKWLKICHSSNRESIKEDIENVKDSKGQTLFDMLIEIINDNDHVELRLE